MARQARAYSAKELSTLLDYDISHINKTVKNRHINFCTKIEDGQEVRHFHFRDLPEHWQSAINRAECRKGYEAKRQADEEDRKRNEEIRANMPAIIPANLPATITRPELHNSSTTNGKQERVITGRMYLMRRIERRVEGKTVTQAIRDIVAEVTNQTDELLVKYAAMGNDRKGQTRGISEPTLNRWWAAYQKQQKNAYALTPVKGDKLKHNDLCAWLQTYQHGTALTASLPLCIPPWLPFFLDQYRVPQKLAMKPAWRKTLRTLPEGIERPTYEQIRGIMKKVPVIYAEKGRMTNAEYTAIQGYVERDASQFAPMSICQIDGHSFKAYVAHPVTGEHFHPEVCGVIDLTTKLLVGWAAGLAESAQTVGDAYRHCCLLTPEKPYGGVPAILEADRGAGNMAKQNSAEFTGLFDRIGTEFIPPERGGNPQGHGAIERSNQSIWIAAAKNLPTYTGKDMDRGIKRKVYDRLERDLKAVQKAGKLGLVEKTSDLLLSWQEFKEFMNQSVLEYNSLPHSALPKIYAPLPFDPNGKPVNRNMSPLECWHSHLKDGFVPPDVGDGMLLDRLFSPREIVTVKREKFTLLGNIYHSIDLEPWHGREVVAEYSIHDANRVTVLDADENFICFAKWNGNRVFARPVTKVEKATMQRSDRRRKLKERQLALIEAEANDKTITVAPLHIELEPHVIEGEARREKERLEQLAIAKIPSNPHELQDDIRERAKIGAATIYEIQWADDKEASFGNRYAVGLFKSDPYCQGRFLPENQFFPGTETNKAVGAENTNGFQPTP